MSSTVKEAYADWAETYDSDRNLTRDLDEEVTRATLADARFESALELGCGTGKNSTLLAGIAKRVLALDFSTAMIAKAREKAAFDNLIFTVADITQPWPVSDLSVDLISCNLVLEHIEDLSFIFSQAARVLLPRGQFLVNELHPFRQYRGTKARFTREAETIEIPAFTHHISDFLNAATANNLGLVHLKELWHSQDDRSNLPRLVSFLFRRA
jgi:malonyl-CoA O-methyltransferase